MTTKIQAIQDREVLHAFLSRDPGACTYQLGDLDDAYFPWCHWWGAYEDGEMKLLLLLYKRLSVAVTLTHGDGALVSALFETVYNDLPDRFYAQVIEDHLDGLSPHYECDGLRPMLRMILHRDDYEPVDVDRAVIRLGQSDTARIIQLYTHYPDNFFEPHQLETGLYFGVQERAGGRLVSIAGIHTLSAAYDVAAIGNLVTHPDYRGRKLARRVTGRLLNELFERVSLVALNVSEENVAAVQVYRDLGFQPHLRYYEGLVKRRMLP